MSATEKTLHLAVAEKPFPDYQHWWPMGTAFIRFMSQAIVSEWATLPGNDSNLEPVKQYVNEYVTVVYSRDARPALVEEFVNTSGSAPFQSGEFDALSYAFFRSAFDLIAQHAGTYEHPLEVERRRFTKRVGKAFFQSLHTHLALHPPKSLGDEQEFRQLQTCLRRVGEFLAAQGYLRKHFRFLFSVDVEHAGRSITQTDESFLDKLHGIGIAYALYEMAYPAILPSAVYLYNTIGEAQHHSSRTIEELFERVGCEARETDDFDPTSFPSNRVVELWEIRPSAR